MEATIYFLLAILVYYLALTLIIKLYSKCMKKSLQEEKLNFLITFTIEQKENIEWNGGI